MCQTALACALRQALWEPLMQEALLQELSVCGDVLRRQACSYQGCLETLRCPSSGGVLSQNKEQQMQWSLTQRHVAHSVDAQRPSVDRRLRRGWLVAVAVAVLPGAAQAALGQTSIRAHGDALQTTLQTNKKCESMPERRMRSQSWGCPAHHKAGQNLPLCLKQIS